MRIDLDRLEYRVSREFRHLEPPAQSWWCDGFMPGSGGNGAPTNAFGRVWLGGFQSQGATYQECWTYEIVLTGPSARGVPSDDVHGWLEVDWKQKQLRITL